jgi:hypothetical protein
MTLENPPPAPPDDDELRPEYERSDFPTLERGKFHDEVEVAPHPVSP